MAEAAHRLKVTYAEYLAAELLATEKHEYVDGEVYAMSGGTLVHSLIATNINFALMSLLRDRPCVVLNSDARVRVLADDVGTYPDVTVVCGPIQRAPDDHEAVINPVVLVEVLSDSTEGYDRGKKFARYRHIPSLQEYVLVSQHEPRVEVYRRGEGRSWMLTEYGEDESFPLESVGITVSVAEVWRNVAALMGTTGTAEG